MGASKFFDDPSLKFVDDPQPTLKFRDDVGSLKFRDDHGTLKFRDDPKLKFVDDPKRKFADDPKLKFVDDPIGTFKGIDDIKLPAFDVNQKFAGTDQIDPGLGDPFTHAGQPFILSTPHHSMEWQASMGHSAQDPNDPQFQLAQFESHIKELEMMRDELQKQSKQLDEYYATAKKEYTAFADKQKKTTAKNKTKK